MATTTYIMFWAILAGATICATTLFWWHQKEIRRVDKRIDMHDITASETSATIAKMSTDIAVTRKAVENIATAVADTKTSIAEINRTLLDKLTK
jgi:septal ring factor EnvC (AmiA/AmiB activator)